MRDGKYGSGMAPVEGFERVKRKLEGRLRMWKMTVVAGAAMAALVPAAVIADEGQVGANGGGILQTIQHALATLALNTTQIAALQAGATAQNAQLAQMQQQLQAQNAQIATLQAQLNAEAAARATGDSSGRSYSDTETNRAKAAEGVLAASVATLDNTATLAAAKAYTDAEMARAQNAESGLTSALSGEIAARKEGDADTLAAAQASINAETARAKAAEAGTIGPDHTYTDQQVAAEAAARQAVDAALLSGLNGEIARAQAAEAGLIGTAEGNLTTLARLSTSAQDFWQRIANGDLP